MNEIKNKKILLVGYYCYEDGYLAGGKALEDLGNEVAFFPLIDFKNQKGNIQDLINIINGVDDIEKSYQKYKNDTPNKSCDIALWWHSSAHLSIDLLTRLKNETRCKYIQLNWDASWCDKNKGKYWNDNLLLQSMELFFFDKVLTCNSNIIKYLQKKTHIPQKIIHFNAGFNKDISYYSENENYKCDISIICTSLYEDLKLWENTKICRKDLVDAIYSMEDIDFHFYGPENFKDKYPRAYKEFIPYKECYKVFSNSKINLNISPVGDSLNDNIDGEQLAYMSERAPQILACKGLMICDTNLAPLLIPDKDYIKIDNIQNFIELIPEILNNDEKYNKIRENGYNKAMSHLQWKDILVEIVKE